MRGVKKREDGGEKGEGKERSNKIVSVFIIYYKAGERVEQQKVCLCVCVFLFPSEHMSRGEKSRGAKGKG